MAGIVAASGPGDLAYGLRIAAERIPARLSPDAEARVRAELGIASRRLADLDRTMRSQDQELDERTVSALLVSVETAAEMATSLSEPVRTEIAARIAEQAELLGQLKRSGAPRTGTPKPCRPHPGEPIAQPNAPVAGRYHPRRRRSSRCTNRPEGPTATPHGCLTPAADAVTRLSCHRDRVAHAPSASPSRAAPGGAGRQQATPQARPTATAGRNTPQATPVGPGPTATSPGPGPTATSPGPKPTATAPGPGPDCDFARPCDYPALTDSLARPWTHFTGPRTGFAPCSFARTARLAAIRAPNIQRKPGEKDSRWLSFAAPSKPDTIAGRDRRWS